MVRILSAVLFLTAVSARATPAIPSFEFSVAQIQSSVAALRAEQVKAKAGNIGPQIDSISWDLERYERETSRLRNDLRWLLQRVRRHGMTAGRPGQPGFPGQPGRPGQPGQPDNDPSLRWDLQRFTRDLGQITRDTQWRLNDLRNLSAQAEKDETLIQTATRLQDNARRFKNETNWLMNDARFAYFDLMRAGFTFEGMDLDRNSRDVDSRAQDFQGEAERLLAKIKG